jgi:hypothetical protein
MAIANLVSAQLEQVAQFTVDIFEDSEQISSLFKKNARTIKQLSRYLYRFPIKLYRGGTGAKYNANGGALPVGTSMKLNHLQAGYIYWARTYRVTDEEVDLTHNTKASVVDVLSTLMSEGPTEMAVDDDIALHGDGTGILTEGSSAVSATTMTFAAVDDNLGVSNLREGMAVDVWDSTGATKRALTTAADAPLVIIAIDDSTNTITFNTAVAGITAGDIVAFKDMDAYGPSTLTAGGAADWPATNALTSETGLGGDSFRHGLRYAHNDSSSSYYLGKQRSVLPKMIPIKVPGQGQQITFAMGMDGLDRLDKRRNPGVRKGLFGIFPMAQRAVVQDIGVTIANKPIQGSFGNSVDMAPSNIDQTSTFEYCGMTCYVSKRQPNNRVDFVNPSKNWGRAEQWSGARPYKDQNGNTTWRPVSTTTGLPLTVTEFGWHSCYDFVCFDPGSEFYIDNLAVA